MPLPPFTGNRGALSPHLPLRGRLFPQGEKALGLFFTDSRLRRFVILIQRRGVAAVQSVAGQGRQQLPAEVETSVIRLAEAIQKTQKRANALGNVQIPQMQKTIKSIDEVLSEREREEFSRLKVIKAQKEKEEA